MLRDEVVVRRKWLTEEHFLDLLGATNLIPGPNSTEMVIHVGHERAGWKGLIAAGVLFILPAAVMVALLAWIYTRYGSTPAGQWLLYGIKPVLIAVLAQALWGLLRTAVKGLFLGIVGAAVLVLYLLGVNEIALLFGAGLLVMGVENARRIRGRNGLAAVMPLLPLVAPVLGQAAAGTAAPFSLLTLFLTFLKIGAVLYGSGYVLLAFLRSDFVERLGWLTDRQLLDAVAVGQFTPGPVLTTATFVGFLVGSWPGAVLATVGIFLPSFLFVAALNPLVPRLRRSPWMAGLLDGVNVAAVGLMAAVAWELGRSAVVDPLTAILALAAGVLLIRYRINSAWLVLAGGLIGLAARLLMAV
jgi:chromate transporter